MDSEPFVYVLYHAGITWLPFFGGGFIIIAVCQKLLYRQKFNWKIFWLGVACLAVYQFLVALAVLY
ncbi:MAG: hypothetical protein V4465_02195 [Patescibacteria group bacterium]